MTRQRVNVQEAAEYLGTSVEALRKRIARGSLDSEREKDGRVYVWIDTPDGGRSFDQTVSSVDSHQAIIRAKDETIELLRRELDIWQEESRRKDHLLAALTARIPELEPAREAASEPPEAPVTASEDAGKDDTPPDTERRSWWQLRWWFGR